MEDYKKKYEEALQRAKQFSEKPYLEDSAGIVEYIFPELKESEDEKVKKEIKQFIRSRGMQLAQSKVESWIAWLEKQCEQKAKYHDVCDKCIRQPTCQSDCFLQQGEQKPAWSEEDEEMLENAISSINHDSVIEGLKSRGISYSIVSSAHLMENLITWLKSLKNRVQPKQEWGEEDKKILNRLISSLARIGASTRTDSTSINYTFSKEIDWLKSLRPQNRWKPSEEQMKQLGNCIHKTWFDRDKLVELYNELIKL